MRRVLVTGASRGIGRSVAKALAQHGFSLALHYKSQHDAARAVADEVRALGAEATLLSCDIADRDACRAAFTRELAENGPFFGVVLNAGIHADAAFPSLKGDDWDRVLRTNLDGFYNTLHPLVMPMVRAHDGGRIVAISSIAGIAGNRGQVNYAASKAGLIGAVPRWSEPRRPRRSCRRSRCDGSGGPTRSPPWWPFSSARARPMLRAR